MLARRGPRTPRRTTRTYERTPERCIYVTSLTNRRVHLLRNSHGRLKRDEFKAHGFGLGAEFDLLAFLMAKLVGSELRIVELLPGGNQVKNDAGELVSSGGNGLWGA